MPKFIVTYQQREIRSATFDATDEAAARRHLNYWVERDQLPAGSFEQADEQKLLCLKSLDGTVLDWFDKEEN